MAIQLSKRLTIPALVLLITFSALGGQESLQKHPNSDALLGPSYTEAKQLLDKHKWVEAISAFRTLLKTDPKSELALLGLARALTYAGKREEALSLLFRSAEDSQGLHRKNLFRKARVLSCLFLTNKTFQIYQDGLNLIVSKKYRNAKDRLEKALSEENSNVEILVRLGQALVLDGDYEGALGRFIVAKKLNPHEPEIRLWLGRTLSQKGLPNHAMSDLRFAHHQMQESEQATVWLAEALAAAGQVNAALRVLGADSKKYSSHLVSLVTGARIRMQLNHPDAQTLLEAKKDLNLAMIRLERVPKQSVSLEKGDLSLDTRKSEVELKAEIQKLQGQLKNLRTKSPEILNR